MGSTNIVCNVAGSVGVDVEVYDAAGRLVRAMDVPANGDEMSWDGRDTDGRQLPPGVYVCKMKTGRLSLSRKVVLLE
jgi:flagellar hook assembly protein FlgD